MKIPTSAQLQTYADRFEQELFERVLPFWEHHSPDRVHGGYFNNLDRDGSVYDTTKHIWLQARQVWMFSKLYRTVEARPAWLDLARLGMEFIRTHAARPNGQVYFSLAQDGKPIYQQRKTFTECFYLMALAEYGRASDQSALVKEAKDGVELLWTRSYDWSTVGRPSLPGTPPSQALAVPMMLLNVLDEVMAADFNHCMAEVQDCIRRIQLHTDPDSGLVYEHVTPEGSRLDGPMGRLLNPGHAIEAGWFLQHIAQKLHRDDVAELAVNMIRWSHRRGWDREQGGLFYFLDSEGHSPVPLEWSMKLWWPHCEALYAHLLNFALSGDVSDWQAFQEVEQYTFKHFSDPEYGEWFGYLDREGRRTHRFKGSAYKGCFHVPRALWLCLRLLKRWPAEAT